MSDSTVAGWPVFELVTLLLAPNLPPEARILATRGVPKRIIGREFTALSEAHLMATGSGQTLVAFGSSGLRGMVCLDTADCTVVHVPNLDGRQVNPVNANIDKFTECVSAVIGRFPFYGDDDELDLGESVADELTETLAAIDETTRAHNCFWVTFVDDVRMGDYATTMIVGE